MAVLDYGLEGLGASGLASGIGQVIENVQERQRIKETQIEHDRIRDLEQAFELKKFAVAKEWEIQKMQLASQLDFENEMKLRREAEDEYNATIKYLEGRDDITDEQKKVYGFKAFMKKQGVNVSESLLLPKEPRPAGEATVANQITALKELQKSIYKEPTAAEKIGSKLTLGLWGRKELKPEIQAQKAFLQNIVGSSDMAGVDLVTSEAITDAAEPQNFEEFKSTVRELKKLDARKSQAYYNKYIVKFRK